MLAIFNSIGYEQLTSITSATGITSSLYQNADGVQRARRVLLQAETQDVRWRDDGTDPTASVGMILTAGGAPILYEGELDKIRFIQATAGAVLNVTVYA